VWRFRAPDTGTAPIKLELRKPGETAAAQTYMITVKPE
jgi:predicted secreted protein